MVYSWVKEPGLAHLGRSSVCRGAVSRLCLSGSDERTVVTVSIHTETQGKAPTFCSGFEAWNLGMVLPMSTVTLWTSHTQASSTPHS